MEDVQNQAEGNTPLDEAGISGLRYPITIQVGGDTQHTIATLSLTTNLSSGQKGVHMSRFVEAVEDLNEPLTASRLERLTRRVAADQEQTSSEVAASFPFFLQKESPATQASAKMAYDATIACDLTEENASISLRVVVTAATVCPCSKAISTHGAHNQRVNITVRLDDIQRFPFNDAVRIAEDAASTPVYPLVKRADEKAITETGYDNPKFVEDVARALNDALSDRFNAFSARVESEESIHGHNALARVSNKSS